MLKIRKIKKRFAKRKLRYLFRKSLKLKRKIIIVFIKKITLR
jgi:hypothetical protein